MSFKEWSAAHPAKKKLDTKSEAAQVANQPAKNPDKKPADVARVRKP